MYMYILYNISMDGIFDVHFADQTIKALYILKAIASAQLSLS